MKASKVLLLSSVVVAIPGLVVAAGPTSPFRAARIGSVCEQTARVLRESARNEAHADFWRNIGRCLNDSEEIYLACSQEVLVERQEALALAEAQYQARLDACAQLDPGPYDPEFPPDDFSTDITNLYRPAVVGRVLVYEKDIPEGHERIVVTTLPQTAVIDGVLCRVVSDVVTLDGVLIEDTIDWIAQHDNGDVWYFGEISKNFEDGFLDNLDGSFRSGVEDAKPGILMHGTPELGKVYRQEFFLNEAEDLAKVVALDETVTVQAGTFHHCIQTEEWTPLSPDAIEWKYYAPGVGMVLEINPDTGEMLELTAIR